MKHQRGLTRHFPSGTADARALQLAAMPVRSTPRGCEIMLVTSRESRRWIIPKGWPMKKRKPHRAAEREAYEEAGVRGRIHKKPIGEFTALKRLEEDSIQCTVRVFLLDVVEEHQTWKEMHERQREWFTMEEAAERVGEPGLAELIASLPARL